MKLEVAKNAKRNIIVGIFNKVLLLILPFVSRMIINRTLGSRYLGLNSLFSSILNVLTLSELGLSSALVYHMYKPIAEDDFEKVGALLNFYRKAYFTIGCIITLIGVAISPFIPSFISGGYPVGIDIYVVYYVQLFNTVISYFLFGYKQSLLTAHQREDINSIINLFTQLGLQLVQIILLINTKNYYYYVLAMPIFTIVNNLWIAYFTKKIYPNVKCEGILDSKMLTSIKKLVAGSFIQKACATTRNSFDSICISAFVGLSITAIYNNYYTIFNGITLLLSIIGTSISGGIGNHIVIKSKEENFEELKKIDFLYLMISGWCTACLLCLSQTFMKIWMGDDMLFSMGTVINMCVYFYTLKLGDIRGVYYNANGMWWEMRYRSIVETISNLVLNIGLGYFLGINGIILATTISLLFFNFLWGSNIVFEYYFGKDKLFEYFRYHIRYFINTLIVCGVTYCASSKVELSSLSATLIVKGLICIIIGGGISFALNFSNRLFRPAMKMIFKKDDFRQEIGHPYR